MSSLRQWFRNKCRVIVELSPMHLVSVDTEIDRGLLRIAVINSTKTNSTLPLLEFMPIN